MDELEKLFDCADRYLRFDDPDWIGFTQGFQSVFKAGIVIYRAHFSSPTSHYSNVEILGSSNLPLWQDYVAKGLHEHHILLENQLPSLEPIRRSDHAADDMFIEHIGEPGKFFLKHDVFNFLMIHAPLSDLSFLALMVWRGREESNFTDDEKLQFALVVRYVLAMSGGIAATKTAPLDKFKSFATQYGLTPTEANILSALVHGKSLKEIADDSDRSYGTVRWHVQNILEKSRVGSQKELMREFYELMNSAAIEAKL